MSIRSRLHRVDPYANFPDRRRHVDKTGFGANNLLLRWALAAVRPKTIIEVGSWKGMSAITMARAARQLDLDCEIVCVDTWIGSVEHLMAVKEDWRASLRYENGYPRLYDTFMSNVLEEGLEGIITPFPATSENAAAVFNHWGIKADLIYIDAAHEYGAVKRDIREFWSILADEGLMILDDYGQWPGVTAAVDESVLAAGLEKSFLSLPGKAIVARGENRAFAKIKSIALDKDLVGV